MDHRHLLPEEIDLLLDGEEGFGVNPLKAHVAQCAGCRAEYEAQREVAAALETLPHFAPSPRLADRVMAQVQIFEPWHVTLRDRVARALPRTQGGRTFVFGTAGVMAVTMSVLTVWLAHRADAVLFLAALLGQRMREAVAGGVNDAVVSAVGQGAATTVASNGLLGVGVAVAVLALAVFGTAFGLKSLASAPRGRRG
ncbi:MAG: hypothetical protein IPF98_15170 [Gemmatimonadetes bacterium]|nr:hypothetical protein [Gemmatimonadota bacterium]MCC6770298.1 hypothetical protein [Gemmatimonadaceae bacterium]